MNDENDGRLLARLEVQCEHLEKAVEALTEELKQFVRLSRFRPIELAVYGMVSLLCGALLTAIVSKVLH